MTTELTFDLMVDLKFLVTGQLPLELKHAIGERKNDIHASLSRDPRSQKRLIGTWNFKLKDGDEYQVDFVSDVRHPTSELQPLRVTHIEKL